MTHLGHVQNGVIVPEEAQTLPEGATVRFEVINSHGATPKPRRTGGNWKGLIRIAEDFDELPPDIAEAFGINPK